MKMRSMAQTKSESNMACPVEVGKNSGPRYPFGLEISLDDASLKKLGIGELPAVGTYVKLRASARVTNVSSSENNRSKNGPRNLSRNVRLQIERLAVDEDEPESMEEAVEKGAREA